MVLILGNENEKLIKTSDENRGKTEGVIVKEKSFLVNREVAYNTVWAVGNTLNTNASPYVVTMNFTSKVGKLKATVILIELINKSGATETYNWKIENLTTGATLGTGTTDSIVNDGGSSTIRIYSTDKIKITDNIKITINDGILGTSAGNLTFAHLLLKQTKIEEIDEEELKSQG